jgi:excisionase family DNA binding protein
MLRMVTPMKLSLSQAAKKTGVSKPTLSRWVKKGEISAEKLANGGYLIDASELDRVMSMKERGNSVTGNGSPEMLQTVTPNETSMLHREVELLVQRLKDREGEIDDLRRRLDTESEERRKLTMMLLDRREKKGLLQRIFA